ncbi:MAG: two-component system sensor histidine kinase NtrB [bacterium]
MILNKEKMEALERLARCMAHDFNNLLTTILGYSELMLNTVAKDDPMHEDIEEIRQAGKRAAYITEQFLNFGAKQKLQQEHLNPHDIISEMKRKLTSLAGNGITISITTDSDLGTIYADKEKIEQVIMNLVINAREAMIDGGNLNIKVINEIISSPSPRKYICIVIEDTGIGMTEETMDLIFEPFFSTHKKRNGSGFGLSTAYGIVKQHKGWINVQSELEHGSTFKVYLPSFPASLS